MFGRLNMGFANVRAGTRVITQSHLARAVERGAVQRRGAQRARESDREYGGELCQDLAACVFVRGVRVKRYNTNPSRYGIR